MSIFIKNLKTFTSDFTGEEKEYRVNNKLWVTMQQKFKVTQAEWAKGYEDQRAYYGAMFAYSLLVANKVEVTFDDIIENTDLDDINKLMAAYIDSLYDDEDIKKALDEIEKLEGEGDNPSPS